MAIVMRMEAPGGTLEQYDKANEIIGIEGDADAPDGLIFHVAGKGPDGIVIIDVWESEEKLNRFFEEKAGAALAQAGLEAGPPEIMPLHSMIPQGAGTQGNVIMEARTPIDQAEYDRMVTQIPSHAGDGSGHPVVTHIAAVDADGTVYVADLWESPEAFAAFAQEEIVPAAQEGMELSPSFHPVHNVLRGSAAVSA
jgi:heme-degrading monooxygenase HmoA